MITIAETVLVPHPPDVVWQVISDPQAVVSCIEGSELGEQHEDGTFDARLAVKFAAIKVAFAARVRLDLDEVERVGRMEAEGADKRGSTRVQGNAAFTVLPAPQGSEVMIDGVVELNGQLASLVTTGAAVVVDRMTRQFAVQLAAECADRGTTAAGPQTAADQTAAASTDLPATPAASPTVAPHRSHGDERWWQRMSRWWKSRRTSRGTRSHGKKKKVRA